MRKIVLVFLAVLLLLGSATVYAEPFDPARKGSVSVTLADQTKHEPVAGAELFVYRVATVTENERGNLTYGLAEAFASSGIRLHEPELAQKLEDFITGHPELPFRTMVTDQTGTARLEDLELGMYYICQNGAVEGFAPCAPFLVTVPMYAAGGYEYHVNATPKTEVQRLFSITIKKVWNTDSRTEAADRVTVQLLLNGNAVATSVLSEENNWQVTYTDLPESDRYSVKELHVPKDFTATYKKNGNVFTVTNTSTLIKTGQLIWPIPVLAICGVLLLSVGTWLLQKKRKTHE